MVSHHRCRAEAHLGDCKKQRCFAGRVFDADVRKECTARNNEIQKYMEAHIDTPNEKQLLENIVATRKVYIETRNQISAAKKDGKSDEVTKLFAQFLPQAQAYQKSLLDFLDYQKIQVDDLSKHVDDVAQDSKVLVSSLIVLFLVSAACAPGI